MSILIIEDESLIRSVLTEILEDEGYCVASAANGLAALTYLHSCAERPQLILLDLGMPIMTGWEFRKEQLYDPNLAGIPVIVMSALPNLDQSAAVLGVAGCLDKPIDINLLLGTVAQHCHLNSRHV